MMALIYKVNLTRIHHLVAQKGDIFEVQKTQEDWLQVNLFSGATWFVKESEVRTKNGISAYPADPSTRNKLCLKTEKIKHKVAQKAMAEYPDDMDREATYERKLFDKYMLETFRNFGVPAAHYSKLTECINDNLIGVIRIEN